MENHGSVTGLFGSTLQEVLDLVHDEKHTFKEILIIATTMDGGARLLKTRMSLKDMSFLAKVLDVVTTKEYSEHMGET